MKKFAFLFMLLCCGINAMAQNDNSAEITKLIGEGVSLNDEGKYEEAIKKFDKALKLDPKNATASYEKAFTLYSRGDKDKAKKLLEKSVDKVTPNLDYAAIYMLLATIYDEDGDPLKSIETYKKALEIENLDFYYYSNIVYNLGITYTNAHRLLNDDDNQHLLDALNTLTLSFRMRPQHPGSCYQLYQTWGEVGAFTNCFTYLSMYAICGQKHSRIDSVDETVKSFTSVDLDDFTFSSREDSIVITKCVEIGKQPRSEYGLTYDVFTGVFKALCADIKTAPLHPSDVSNTECVKNIHALYAKLIRDGEFETLMHHACCSMSANYIGNKNWITKNQDHLKRLSEILEKGEYLAEYKDLKGDLSGSTEIRFTAEEAHEHNAEALLMMDQLLSTKAGTDESNEAAKFLLAWLTSSPDVMVTIGDVVAEVMDENNGILMFAYMVGGARYQLENGSKDFDEDAFYAGIKTLLTYYEKNRDVIGTIPQYEDYLKQLSADESHFKAEIVKRIPKE